MIYRTYLGLDVRPRELRAVALRRKGKSALLSAGRILPLEEGLLNPSLREPNLLDPRRFAEEVRKVLDPLAGREERISLTLPETVGRLLLVETETAFKTKAEGIDILKWQLKGSLPVDPRELQLDYQVLKKKEDGGYRLAVALMVRTVLQQYEEALVDAGYCPGQIDFHASNLYNYFRPRLDLGENFVLLAIEGASLSLQVFQGRTLAFHRSREVGVEPAAIFQELTRSLAGGAGQLPAFHRAPVFLHSDWQEPQPLLETVGSAFEREAVLLDPHLERLTPADLNLSPWQARGMAAAVGAAERMM